MLFLIGTALGQLAYYPNQLKIGTSYSHKGRMCSLFKLTLSNARVAIQVDKLSGVKSITFTDKLIDTDCLLSSAFQKCSESLVCSSWQLQNSYPSMMTNTTNSLDFQSAICLQTLYIYVQNQPDFSNASNFKTAEFQITTKAVPVTCRLSQLNPYQACGQLQPDSCKNDCQLKCVWVKCMGVVQQNQQSLNTQLFGLCMPRNLTSQQYLNKCSMSLQVINYQLKDNCKNIIDRTVAKGEDNPVVTVLILLFLAFIACCLYYNYKLKKDGVVPFQAPRLCPDCLFPRPTSLQQQANYMNLN